MKPIAFPWSDPSLWFPVLAWIGRYAYGTAKIRAYQAWCRWLGHPREQMFLVVIDDKLTAICEACGDMGPGVDLVSFRIKHKWYWARKERWIRRLETLREPRRAALRMVR